MLQLQLHVIQAETTRENNKGSADMKESTFLHDWDVLYYFVVVDKQNEKSFRLNCCCKSVFSSLKQVKILLYSHVKEYLLTQTVGVVTNFGLNADVHRGVRADPGGASWT